jgi:hypothetical protein
MCYKTHSLRANDVLYPLLNLVSLSLTHRHTHTHTPTVPSPGVTISYLFMCLFEKGQCTLINISKKM